jgi:hypothetical protein
VLIDGKSTAYGRPREVFSHPELDALGVGFPAVTEAASRLSWALEDGTLPVTVEEALKAGGGARGSN